VPAAFDSAVLAADPDPRGDVLAALAGALAAADPGAAVRRHFHRSRHGLQVGGARMPLPKGRIFVLAFGKAAPAMAGAALAVLDGGEIAGLVASPSGAGAGPLEAVAAGHPLPNAGSLAAGRRLLELAGRAGRHDLVLVLVSGGGSALAEAPAPGLNLADLEEVNRALLRSGAPITAVNTVRRHLSAFKGGRLAAAAAPARLITLILSDVVGSPLEAIAGGPTVPDPTTFADARAVLRRWGVSPPSAAAEFLAEGEAGRRPETPKGGEAFAGPVVVVADGAAAAEGAAIAARERGLRARVASTLLEGEARLVGARLAARARRLQPGTMVLFAGETTVTVTGAGRGGRNQELALAAGIALERSRTGALVASFATDGVDGPTDAAGGIGDAGTVARGERLGRKAAAALAANDALPYLEATGDLLRCGPTGTNVGDVMVAYRPSRRG
jgi:hydroxypyruvate reductase